MAEIIKTNIQEEDDNNVSLGLEKGDKYKDLNKTVLIGDQAVSNEIFRLEEQITEADKKFRSLGDAIRGKLDMPKDASWDSIKNSFGWNSTLNNEEIKDFQKHFDNKTAEWEGRYNEEVKALDEKYPNIRGYSASYGDQMNFDQKKADIIRDTLTSPLAYFVNVTMEQYVDTIDALDAESTDDHIKKVDEANKEGLASFVQEARKAGEVENSEISEPVEEPAPLVAENDEERSRKLDEALAHNADDNLGETFYKASANGMRHLKDPELRKKQIDNIIEGNTK